MHPRKLFDSGYDTLYNLCSQGDLTTFDRHDEVNVVHNKKDLNWRVYIRRFHQLFREAGNLRDIILGNKDGFIIPEDFFLLEQAQNIFVYSQNGTFCLTNNGDPASPLFYKLSGYVGPTPFIELFEQCAALQDYVFTGEIYKCTSEEFRSHLEDASKTVYKAALTFNHCQRKLEEHGLRDSERDIFEQGEEAAYRTISSFVMSVPAYTVKVFLDGVDIVDETDTEQKIRSVCSIKEAACIAEITRANLENNRSFLDYMKSQLTPEAIKSRNPYIVPILENTELVLNPSNLTSTS